MKLRQGEVSDHRKKTSLATVPVPISLKCSSEDEVGFGWAAADDLGIRAKYASCRRVRELEEAEPPADL